MKIASTLTNTTLGETSLPSLLSSDGDLSLLPLGATSLPANDPASADQPQSLNSFDAMMAMFGLAPNLPLPSLPVSVVAPDVVPNTEAVAVSALGLTAIPTVVMNAAPMLPRDAVSPSISSETAAMPQAPVVSLAAPVIADSFTTPATDFPSLRQANDSLEPLPQEGTKLSTTVSEPNPSVQLKTSALIPASSSKPIALPKLPLPESTSLPALEESVSESTPRARTEMPTVSRATAMDSEPTSLRDAIDVPRHFSELRPQTAEAKDNRHRHAAADRQPVAEVTNSVRHATETIGSGPKQFDTKTLTEQLSVALQTHHQELAAGQPIELQLRLDPPELGMVRVHLRMTEDSVSVRFIAGDEAVTRILESQLPDLRQSLAERGLAFVHCDAGTDSRNQPQTPFGGGADDRPLAAMRVKGHLWQQPLLTTQSVRAHSARLDILV